MNILHSDHHVFFCLVVKKPMLTVKGWLRVIVTSLSWCGRHDCHDYNENFIQNINESSNLN